MPGKSKEGGGLESSPIYKKQAYGTAKSPFMMKGYSYPGHSPLRQTNKKPTEKKIDDLADVLDLIPGSEYVKKAFSNIKEKIHKSDFAKKHLIVDPKKTKLSKVGEFVKKHTE